MVTSHVADFLAQKKSYDALGYEPPAGSQLTETRYAIIACLESLDAVNRHLLSTAALSGGSFQSLGRWVSSHAACAISGKRGTVVFFLEGMWPELPSYCYGFQRARRREVAVASHLALAARCRHEGISFVDESLDMANAFGSLDRSILKT